MQDVVYTVEGWSGCHRYTLPQLKFSPDSFLHIHLEFEVGNMGQKTCCISGHLAKRVDNSWSNMRAFAWSLMEVIFTWPDVGGHRQN